jgi:hypothetical protein
MGNPSSNNPISEGSDNQAVLQIKAVSGVLLRDVSTLFSDLEFSYGSVAYFFWITDKDNGLPFHILGRFWYYEGHFPLKEIFLRDTDLRLYSANFNSPGIWEFLGKINPLEVIRLMINDHYERQHRERFIPYERRKRELENLILENQVVSERVEILRQAGMDQAQIDAVIRDTVLRPVSRLAAHQDSGLIRDASLRRLSDRNR